VRQSANEVSLLLDPRVARHVMDTLSRLIQQMLAEGNPPVVLCSPGIRLAFRRFFEGTFTDLSVLSYAEVPSRLEVQSAGTVPCPEGV
jgi:flagellar biosynthesis protein FlhA